MSALLLPICQRPELSFAVPQRRHESLKGLGNVCARAVSSLCIRTWLAAIFPQVWILRANHLASLGEQKERPALGAGAQPVLLGASSTFFSLTLYSGIVPVTNSGVCSTNPALEGCVRLCHYYYLTFTVLDPTSSTWHTEGREAGSKFSICSSVTEAPIFNWAHDHLLKNRRKDYISQISLEVGLPTLLRGSLGQLGYSSSRLHFESEK